MEQNCHCHPITGAAFYRPDTLLVSGHPDTFSCQDERELKNTDQKTAWENHPLELDFLALLYIIMEELSSNNVLHVSSIQNFNHDILQQLPAQTMSINKNIK